VTPIGEPADPCPLCGRDNACRIAKGELYKGPCWCHEIIVPGPLLARLAEDHIDPACFCRPCLEAIARLARETDPLHDLLPQIRAALIPR
jgi:hypothetical protein